jgi:hypothetical protein
VAGDTANPRIWTEADVWVAPPLTIPTIAPGGDLSDLFDLLAADLSAEWDALGLLSEDGMTEHRDENTTDHFAWGGILVRTTRSKYKRTFKVAALEETAVPFGLVNPRSTSDTDGDVTVRTIIVPQPDPRSFILETRDGDNTRRRYIPRGEVVEVGDVLYGPEEMQKFELTINVYPDGDGQLFYDITNDLQAAVVS